MKILLIHQFFLEEEDAGGSRWNEMCKNWSERGHEIQVLAGMVHANGNAKRLEYKGKYYYKKIHSSVIVHRTHVSENYNRDFLGRLWGYFSFMFSSLWFGYMRLPKDFDVVLVTSPPLFVAFSGYLISRLNCAPLVFEVRDLWPESAIDTGVLKNKFLISLSYRFEKFVYSKSRLINVLTPAFEVKLKQDKGVAVSKLLCIPNAADFSLSEKVLKDFNRDEFRKLHNLEDKFVVSYVGAHGVANHLEQILYAAELLKDTDILFLLIGQGMRKRDLIRMRDEIGLQNVRFIDPVPKSEVFKYISASEMGMSVLKKVDAFKTVYSNKTFDYMSCKVPVLMAIDGVSRELVEKANAGVYVEPENIQEFNSILRDCMNHKELLLSQGLNGFNYAKANFDRQALAAKYLESIEKLFN